MFTNSSIGERVRTLRLASGMSQADLALKLTAGTSKANAYVSKVEGGRVELDGEQIAALADALACSTEYLQRDALEIVATRPWLRAYADAPARTVERVVAENILAEELISTLGLKRITDGIPVFGGDANDDAAIERYADEVRAAASIPEDGVVGNAMRAADRLGCVVLPLNSELGRHLGLSQRVNETPFIRVSRPGPGGVPGDRQRFTVAHEIGHLGLHAETGPPEGTDDARRIERQAHRFASAFIAPGVPLIADWEENGGRVTLSAFCDLKAAWGLSIKALVVRFQQLGVISANQATALYKQISKRGWNTVEPVETTNEEPLWFSKATQQKTGASAETVARTAGERAGLSELYVAPWLDWSPVPTDENVLHLPGRRDPQNSHAVSPGRVISFPKSR